jgi:hypothetical protein
VEEAAQRSPGQTLDPETRLAMERRFGHDFSHVRIHADGVAGEAAHSLQADAFAAGPHLFFAPGRYDPRSAAGRELLAHELAHVVQHPDGSAFSPAAPNGVTVSRPADPLEGEATRAAGQVSAGREIGADALSRATPRARGVIARQAAATQEASAELLLDPAPLVNNLASQILRNLQADPDDRAGRVRRTIANLAPATREEVTLRLRDRMTQARWEALSAILGDSAPAGETSAVLPAFEVAPETPEAAAAPSAAEQPAEAEPAAAEAPAPSAAAEAEAGQAPAKEPIAEAGQQPEAAAEGQQAAVVPELQSGPQPETGGSQAAAPAPAEAAAPAASGGVTLEAPAEASAEPAAVSELQPAPKAEAAQPGIEQPVPAEAPAAEAAPHGPEAAPEPDGAAAAEVNAEQPAAAQAEAVETPLPQDETVSPAAAEVGEVQPAPAGESAPGEAAAPAEAPPIPEPPEPALPSPEAAEAMPEGAPVEAPTDMSVSAPPAETAAEEEGAEAEPSAGEAEAFAAAETQAAAPEPAAEAPTAELPAAASLPEPAAAARIAPAAAPAPPAIAQPEITAAPEIEPAGGELPAPAEAIPAGPEPGGLAPEAPEVMAAPPEIGPGAGAPGAGALGAGAPAPAAAGAGGQPAGCQPAEAPQPQPEADAPSGSCAAGGGGAPAPAEQAAPPAADAGGSDPVSAMAAAGNLPPAQMQGALGGVSAAATSSVQTQRETLAANPPQIEQPTGAPPGAAGLAPGSPLPPPAGREVPRPAAAGAAATGTRAASASAQAPAALATPVPAVAAPPVTGTSGSQLSEADVQHLQSAVHNLPTTDPALNVTAAPPPALVLEGDADPARAQAQREQLEGSLQETRAQGQQDAAQPLGEDQIYPTVQPETLTANPNAPAEPAGGAPQGDSGPGVLGTLAACASAGGRGLAAAQASAGRGAGAAAAGATGAGAAAGGADVETASIIAQEQRGGEIRAAVGQAQTGMTAGQQARAAAETRANQQAQAEVERRVQQNSTEQSTARSRALADVQTQRGDWNREQTQLVQGAQTEAAGAGAQAATDIGAARADGTRQANEHVTEGNRQIGEARRTAETRAGAERRRAEENQGGFFSWVADRVRSFFDGIRNAIMAAFQAARDAVRRAIDVASRLASQAIDAARSRIVDAIRWVGERVVALGDRVLSGFPGLRDRFRQTIRSRIEAAVNTVNRLADGLKRGVQAVLNGLGAALNAALGLLECAYLAEVALVERAVNGAIEFGRNVAQTVGEFAAIIRDVARDPSGWLRSLGRAAMDGVRNCLWGAFKRQVKEWFNQKLEEVLGLGLMIWNLIRSGCLNLAMIGNMAWTGIKQAIPGILIQLIIEKLVAMIVPAAGALMTIIEGLRAAWGTVSRIIQAFQRFMAFLRGVRGGNAAGLFAEMVASAAIVVIDFVANWLLQRLRRPAGAVAGAIRGLAQRILGGVGRALGAVGRVAVRAVRAVGRAFARGGRAAAGGLRRAVGVAARGVRAAGRGLARVGRRVASSRAVQALARTRVGRAVISGARAAVRTVRAVVARGRAAVANARQRFRQWRERRQRRRLTPQERLDRAVSAIQPRLQSFFRRGIPGFLLSLTLAGWRAWYHLTRLYVDRQGPAQIQIEAVVNPRRSAGQGYMPSGTELREIVHAVSDRILERADVLEAAQRMRESRRASRGGPIDIAGPAGFPGAVSYFRARGGRVPGWGRVQEYRVGGTIPVSESQRQGALNAIVREAGTYPEIRREMSNIGRQTGMSDRAMAEGVRTLVQTGRVPPGLAQHERALGGVTMLMFGREAARNPAMVAMAPITLDLIRRGPEGGGLTMQQALSGSRSEFGGGAFPMSMEGAQAATRGLAAEEEGIRPSSVGGGTAAERRELKRREIALCRRWLEAEMRAERLRAFDNRQHCETWIQGRILAFYGMS